jgi:SAM-dependent methyltransferase
VRILVAIANHGTKNHRYLECLLTAYRSMRYEVDIVVLSDAPKELGPDVEVHVGAPTKNPWSLPFAHRKLFAERADAYDLFVYSEDDTLLEERHVDSFVELNELLPEDEIAGFLRFEEYESGERSYCSIHSGYRWLPESVAVHDGEVFASFSNEHSACYVLTRGQLKRAIASGGFLIEPHEGEYDMLVSAATDPYTRCGLRRRICISRIDDVLLHHLPNVYLGRMGISEPELRAQIDALIRIGRGDLTSAALLDGGWAIRGPTSDVPQYPGPSGILAGLAGPGVTAVLSIGCTSGRLERETFGPEVTITGVPFDEVAASVARLRGIQTTSPVLDEALAELGDAHFDTILLHQMLQHAADPSGLLKELGRYLEPGGRALVSVPNARHARVRQAFRKPVDRGRVSEGVRGTEPRMLHRWVREAGLHVEAVTAVRSPRLAALTRDRVRALDSWIGNPLWMSARAPHR